MFSASVSISVTLASCVKAIIQMVDPPGPPIPVMFNPDQLKFGRTLKFDRQQTGPMESQAIRNVQLQPSTFVVNLFYDTSDLMLDVRLLIEPILMLMEPLPALFGPKATSPPTVRFIWGPVVSWPAIVTDVQRTFTHFLPMGIPVRADVAVTFTQCETPIAPTNPTSQGDGGEQIHTVVRGESLQQLAFQFYGDAGRWRSIAEANRLTQVREIPVGTLLFIPPLTPSKGM